jgi:hypothetical protein
MFSNGNSFGASAYNSLESIGSIQRPVPAWKFGVSLQSYVEDRGDI